MTLRCPTCERIFDGDASFCPHDGTRLVPAEELEDRRTDPFLGRILGERYRIDRKIGAGGMGAVYLATHVLMDKPVAVKILRSELSNDPYAAGRFRREARSASRIEHEACVAVTDFGREPDGTLFLVMEYLPGRTLWQTLKDDGALPLERVLDISIQIADALVAAHDKGVIHRDLKPENVMLVQRGSRRDVVKVLDFGLAKIVQASDGENFTALTRQGMVFGTPRYMSPEQIEGKQMDPRTDLYAFGVMIHEMITGKLPFEGPSIMALLNKHLNEKPEPPSVRFPDIEIPKELEELILQMMAKRPDDRPSSAQEVLDRLLAIRLEWAPGLVLSSVSGVSVQMVSRVHGATGHDGGGVGRASPGRAAGAEDDDGELPTMAVAVQAGEEAPAGMDDAPPRAVEAADERWGSGEQVLPPEPGVAFTRSPVPWVVAVLAAVGLVAGWLVWSGRGDQGPPGGAGGRDMDGGAVKSEPGHEVLPPVAVVDAGSSRRSRDAGAVARGPGGESDASGLRGSANATETAGVTRAEARRDPAGKPGARDERTESGRRGARQRARRGGSGERASGARGPAHGTKREADEPRTVAERDDARPDEGRRRQEGAATGGEAGAALDEPGGEVPAPASGGRADGGGAGTKEPGGQAPVARPGGSATGEVEVAAVDSSEGPKGWGSGKGWTSWSRDALQKARAAMNGRDYVTAGKILAKASSARPRDARVQTAWARLHFIKGDYDAAMRYALRAVRFSPGSVRAWSLLGKIAAKKGDLDAACRAYHKVLELRPSNRVAASEVARLGCGHP